MKKPRKRRSVKISRAASLKGWRTQRRMKKNKPYKVTVAWLTKERAFERAEYIFNGPMTINSVPVIHQDGAPARAGDLIKGTEYFVDLKTGALRPMRTIDLLPKVEWK